MKRINRAVITGASSGIGADFARYLAARKTNLFLVARREEQLKKLATELIAEFGIQVEILPLDLSSPESIPTLYREAIKNGSVDLLINNAGIGPWRKFASAPLDEHHKVMQLNMMTLTGLTHYFVKHMLDHNKPSYILNVGSLAAFQPATRYSIYAPSKSFVKMFSEIISEELKETNISVSCLCPGGVATEWLEKNNQTLTGKFNPLMASEKVARIGINGLLKGKTVIIPGISNKFIAVLSRLIPTSWSIKLASWTVELAVKETDQSR